MESSPLRNRRVRERNELRLKILDAARDLFAAGGEDGVTLRAVAQRIEYSVTAIYSQFSCKEALVQELCEAEFAFLSRALQKAAQIPEPLDGLAKLAHAYVDFGLQHPGQYRFLFLRARVAATAPIQRPEEQPTPQEAVKFVHPYDHLRAAVFKAMAAGCFRPEYRSVELISQGLWSSLHGLVALHLARAQHPGVSWRSIQGTTELTLECLLNGLAAPPYQMPPTWTQN